MLILRRLSLLWAENKTVENIPRTESKKKIEHNKKRETV